MLTGPAPVPKVEEVHDEITAYTGGTAACLDDIALEALPLGAKWITYVGGVRRTWTNTDAISAATSADAGVVRGKNHNGTSNTRAWIGN